MHWAYLSKAKVELETDWELSNETYRRGQKWDGRKGEEKSAKGERSKHN